MASSTTKDSPSPISSPFKVAIIGAGPAGCTLAGLLLRANLNISVTIFERESSLTSRNQGGTLDLHKDTGLRAVRALDLYSAFVQLARFDGDSVQIFDKRKIRYLNVRSSETKGSVLAEGKPEIDRAQLRQLLVDALPEETIRWGCDFQGVRGEGEKRELVFEHGVERGFDLIVGADGAFSKLRNVMMEQKACFSRVGGFTMAIPDAEAKYPAIYKLVRRGSVFSFAEGKELIGQQMGDGSTSVTVWLRKDEESWMRSCGFDVKNGEAVKKGLEKEFEDWHPHLLALLRAVDPTTVSARSLFHLPIGARWEPKRGLTLIGDAAHLMTPFVGEGVNAALRDALDLANCIIEALRKGKDVLEGIEKAEDEMMRRVTKAQLKNEDMKNLMMFSKGAPRKVIEKYILRALADDLNRVLLAIAKVVVYSYFFCFKAFHPDNN